MAIILSDTVAKIIVKQYVVNHSEIKRRQWSCQVSHSLEGRGILCAFIYLY